VQDRYEVLHVIENERILLLQPEEAAVLRDQVEASVEVS
jgi:hypothetical protein